MISVIIPAWIVNDELYELTGKTIDSLRASKGWENCELIIIDNASTIGGDQLMSVANTYVRNKVNVGYPKAVNQGIALANGDYIAVVNNDIKISPNWIEVTNQTFTDYKKVGNLHFKMVGYNEPFNEGNRTWETGKERWCTGSFFVFNKMALLKMQDEYGYVMDEEYGLGGYDDWDWHQRLNHELGWSCVYTNKAVYQHKDSTSQNLRNKGERSVSDARNRERFKSKFGDYPENIWQSRYPEQMNKPWKPFE